MGEYGVLGIGESLLIALSGFLIVFCMLLFLILIIKVISAVVVKMEGVGNQAAPVAAAAPASAPAPAAAPAKAEEKPTKPWDGKLQLIDCDEETAACIMAIISDETDIPLDELQFRRIAAL